MSRAVSAGEGPQARAAATLRYHDLKEATGTAGIAMTWEDADGWRAFLVSAEPVDGAVTRRAPVAGPDPASLARAMEAWRNEARKAIRREPDADVGRREVRILRAAFPGPGNWRLWHDVPWGGEPGLLEAHRAAAREAVSRARLPREMADALGAALERGVPDAAGGLVAIRRSGPSARRRGLRALRHGGLGPDIWRSGSPRNSPEGFPWKEVATGEPALWDALALLARLPHLHEILLEPAAALGAGVPAAGALSWTYPGLTSAHVAALARRSPVSAAYVRRLPPGAYWTAFLRMMETVPPDWMPGSEEHLLAALTLSGSLSLYAQVTASPYATLLAPCRGDWRGYLDRCGTAAGIPSGDPEEFLKDIYSLKAVAMRDPVMALAESVVLPALACGALGEGALPGASFRERAWPVACTAAQRLLYGGKGIPALLKQSEAWHGRAQAIRDAGRTGGGEEWPALFEGPYRHGDVEVVALADSVSLAEEGDGGPDRAGVPGLSHCVATRQSGLVRGRSHVLSVRRSLPDGGYERLSTAEVTADGTPEAAGIQVVEHRGWGNSAPHADADAALEAFVTDAGRGLAGVSAEALAPRCAPDGWDAVRAECGYDWRDPDAFARALSAWSDFLPRWTRGLDQAGFVSACVREGALPLGATLPEGSGPADATASGLGLGPPAMGMFGHWLQAVAGDALDDGKDDACPAP